TAFGQLWTLEPLPFEKKYMWQRDMGCLLCVGDHVTEFKPSWQTLADAKSIKLQIVEIKAMYEDDLLLLLSVTLRILMLTIEKVVGDTKGAVFGGLVEARLRPSTKKIYLLRYFLITMRGSNNTFVFTNASGPPVIFRPTGANRYFTLCSTVYLALGGGSHFALYLDSDLFIVKALV
ncbi:oxidation resistance protein 1-like protein, partial [Tanacetum coccineum]